MDKKSPTPEQRLLGRLDRASDEAQLSEADAKALLKEDGVDIEAEKKLFATQLAERQRVERKKREELQEAERKSRLAAAENAYRESVGRQRAVGPRRTREENMAIVRALQQRHTELTAHHHDLRHMSDDDLQSLVDQLNELEGADTEMAIVIKDVPPGHNWGWFSREDPRMHVQTVDKTHLNRYKVWLEERGHRVFLAEKTLPPDVERQLRDEIKARRSEIDAAWISHMINKGWITLSVVSGVITLRVYPGTKHEFTRQIDLHQHVPRHAANIGPADVELSQDPVAVVVWPRKPSDQQEHIDLTDVVFDD